MKRSKESGEAMHHIQKRMTQQTIKDKSKEIPRNKKHKKGSNE